MVWGIPGTRRFIEDLYFDGLFHVIVNDDMVQIPQDSLQYLFQGSLLDMDRDGGVQISVIDNKFVAGGFRNFINDFAQRFFSGLNGHIFPCECDICHYYETNDGKPEQAYDGCRMAKIQFD